MKPPEKSPEITAVFASYPVEAQAGLAQLRDLIFEVGEGLSVQEALRWGQPAYLTAKGSTLRLGIPKSGGFALFAHCQTTIIGHFATMFAGDFRFDGNRAVLFETPRDIQPDKLRLLIRHGLTYHQKPK